MILTLLNSPTQLEQIRHYIWSFVKLGEPFSKESHFLLLVELLFSLDYFGYACMLCTLYTWSLLHRSFLIFILMLHSSPLQVKFCIYLELYSTMHTEPLTFVSLLLPNSLKH